MRLMASLRARFTTPTRVGTTGGFTTDAWRRRAMATAVHPHARGDDGTTRACCRAPSTRERRFTPTRVGDDGSAAIIPRRLTFGNRFTPTRVGTTESTAQGRGSEARHRRRFTPTRVGDDVMAHGGMGRTVERLRYALHAWGRRQLHYCGRSQRRLTPTRGDDRER